VILGATVRERFGAVNTVLLALIYTVVLLQIVVPFYLRALAPGLSGGSALSLFYGPFPTQIWFFFEVLLAASVGAGVIANDVATRSITMYLSRPITSWDYLVAKGSGVALWLGLAVIVPGLVSTVMVLALGYVSLPVALQAAGAFLGVGLLTVLAFTGLAVLLSAWSPKSSYAAASIFGVLVGAEVVALVVQGITGQASILYFSVEQDVISVAQAAFGVSGGILDPFVAGAILIGLGSVTLILTYLSLAAADAVAE
jgi:ABC-type transport system involved in multi-copper enzyme maturation permease subunit